VFVGHHDAHRSRLPRQETLRRQAASADTTRRVAHGPGSSPRNAGKFPNDGVLCPARQRGPAVHLRRERPQLLAQRQCTRHLDPVHPDDDEAWWVDVKAELSEPTRRATRTVWVDKRRQVFDASAASELLRRAVPKDSGLFLTAPPKRETLTSNLLPIVDIPETIYLAPATASTYPDAGELLTAQAGRSRSGWILRDGLVISFGDLREAPLHALCSGDVERHGTAEWADSTDSDTQHRFMDLLARTFAADYWGDLRWHNSRKHLHFCPTADLQPRREGQAAGRRGHTVFGPYYSKKDPDTIRFYRHAALSVRFRRFDGTWYSQLGPDYCFTSDGREEHPYADSLLAGIKRLDRHAAVAGWIRTWATYLTQLPGLVDLSQALTFGELKTF
jgi:hypothetical protein